MSQYLLLEAVQVPVQQEEFAKPKIRLFIQKDEEKPNNFNKGTK